MKGQSCEKLSVVCGTRRIYTAWNQQISDIIKTYASTPSIFRKIFYLSRAERYVRDGSEKVRQELKVECQGMIRSLETKHRELLLIVKM